MGFRWGFDWGKFWSGAGMFAVGGGYSLLLWLGGQFSMWAAGTALVGLILMVNGLVGDEGVW